jgi:solute carrier family 25 oxoglutarate transporter 11
MKKNPDGSVPYSGFIDCAKKTVAREGITGFWAGLPTYYFRVGPHAIIVLLSAEFLRKKMF